MIPAANLMMLGSRRVKPLPYDAEVEYLESTGTQYIKTGLMFNSADLVFDIEMSIDNDLTGWSDDFMGAFISDSNDGTGVRARLYGDGNGNIDLSYLSRPRACPGTGMTAHVRGEGFVSIHMANGYVSVSKNGTVYASMTGGGTVRTPCGKEVFLFAGGQSGQPFRIATGMRVKSYKVTSGGSPVQDMMPVRVGQTGALYDRVSGALLFNEGSGEFVVGSDKWSNPYQTSDGALFAYIDGIWNAGGGVHDSTLDTPIDIMGNVTFTKSGSVSTGETCFGFDGSSTLTAEDKAISDAVNASGATVMVGFRQDTFLNYNGMFRCAGQRGLGYYSERNGWVMSGLNWRGKTHPNPQVVFYTTNGKHYSFVGNGSTLSIWINGVNAGTFNPSQASASITSKLEAGIGYDRNAKGRIYYLRFYRRALTDSEIEAFTATDIARFGSDLP